MFKKTVSTIALLGAIALHGSPADAAMPGGFFFKPYVGADYQYTRVNYENDIGGSGISGDDLANDAIHGANLHIGARVHPNLGFEFGYLWTRDSDKSNILGSGLDSSVNVRGFNLDALGYLPVTSDGKLELIGTVGISRLKAEFEIPTIGSTDDTELKLRFGGGAEYWITDNLNVRGIVRYQGADFSDTVKNAVTANVGLNFQF